MVEIKQIPFENLLTQNYNYKDYNLISSFEITSQFDNLNDVIECFIYDLEGNLIKGIYDLTNYNVIDDPTITNHEGYSTLILKPLEDLSGEEIIQGKYNILYHFLKPTLKSDIDNNFYIKNISSNRTEVRISNNQISKDVVKEEYEKLLNILNNTEYFQEFYLNFGKNNLFIAINIKLDEEGEILIKLYEPLPNEFEIKDELWVCLKSAESIAYNINIKEEIDDDLDIVPLRGPNLNINIKDEINTSTELKNYSELLSTVYTSSFQQVKNLLNDKGLKINIDYTDFNNFIKFSSIEQRLLNFYYKISLIEDYQNNINSINTEITGSTLENYYISGSKNLFQEKIDNIVRNFDGYEYFLYFESSSYSWPKSNSKPPYTLYSTGSNEVLTWIGNSNENATSIDMIYPFGEYGGMALSASKYDESNSDNLLNLVPSYIRNDPQNVPYELFIEMIGHHFDNIWVYIKDITEKNNADNRLKYGISKDLISHVIRDLGLKIYQNNFSQEDLYTAFLGITPSGSYFPPTGSEIIETYVTASNDIYSLDDLNSSLYKRLYHNLPYLLNSKGTLSGLRALISSYGIPSSILRISEFGDKLKQNDDIWDYWFYIYNKCFNTTNNEEEGENHIMTHFTLNPEWNAINNRPGSISFRFKPQELPNSSTKQTLWKLDNNIKIFLEYTGSNISGSYSGSIQDEYLEYGNLILYTPSGEEIINLPFFDGNWWSVLVNSSSLGYEMFTKNKIYQGDDSNILGFQSSKSLEDPSDFWGSGNTSYFCLEEGEESNFNGCLQEIRYYKYPLSEVKFDILTMNPLSIEGNSINSSPDELIFRAPLGAELEQNENLIQESIHPKISGKWNTTHSFDDGGGDINSNFEYNSTPIFNPNNEYIFLDEPITGLKNRISNKIKVPSSNLPEGDTLSQYQKLENNKIQSGSYTPTSNQIEIAFSPQNEINDDISNQLGNVNLGEFIGDNRYLNSRNVKYKDLSKLAIEYFEKYSKNYNIYDYIRLIRFFDNSLFKMIKDFTPANSSLSTGVIIKQHFLERNRYPQPLLDVIEILKEGSISIGKFEGGTGGSLEKFNRFKYHPNPNKQKPLPLGEMDLNLIQTQHNYIDDLGGVFYKPIESQEEFYNGIFSGSNWDVTKFIPNPFLKNPDSNLKFQNSEFDVLSGNGTNVRTSYKIMKVDYSKGIDLPINQDVIIENNGPLAEVQDSNYTIKRHINSRYVGSRTTSKDFNIWDETQVSLFKYVQKVAKNTYGKLPTVDLLNTYFASFDFIKDTSPELKDKCIIHIEYLINENGEKVYINEENIDLIQNSFKSGEEVLISLDDTDVFGIPMKNLNGYRKVYRSGQAIENIIQSENGLGTYNPILYFNTGSFPVKDYEFIVNHTSPLELFPNQKIIYPFDNLIKSPDLNVADWDPINYKYKITDSNDKLPIKFRTKISFTSFTGMNLDCYIYKNYDSGEDEILTQKNINQTLPPGGVFPFPLQNQYVELETNFLDLKSGDEISVVIKNNNPPHSIYINEGFSNTPPSYDYFKVISPITPTGSISEGSGYWFTGSNMDTWLTSSLELGVLYGSKFLDVVPYDGTLQQRKYEPINLDFTIQPGDEFRFQEEEIYSRMVKNTIKPEESIDGKIYVELNRPIPSNININHFTIRRYVDNSSFIIIDAKKPPGPTSKGFIKPKYMTQKLKSIKTENLR